MEFSISPFLLVGKPVRDEYGRLIGRVASFMANLNGRVNEVLVARGDGEFFRYPSSQFITDDDGVMLLSPTKQRAKTLCDQIPLIRRKDQALRGLLEGRKISSEMFDSLHKNFGNALNELEAYAQSTLKDLDKQSIKCTQHTMDISLAMLHLEVEHEIGEIDEKSHRTAIEILEGCLERAEAEREDLEAIKNKLSNMLLEKTSQGETEEATGEKLVPAALMLPEPPRYG